MTRYKYLFFFFFLLSIAFVKSEKVLNDISLPLLGKVIYIDPGHGGRDAGTSYGNILEKEINLDISKILYDKLSEKGALVYMTRETDVDLSTQYDVRKKRSDLYRRIQMIEKAKSDLYLSIHINWYNNSYYSGAEVLYNDINPKNKDIAEKIMGYFNKDLRSNRTIKKTNLYMYSNISTMGVLIECGFLSNDLERELLQTDLYKEQISNSITNAIIDYYNYNIYF